MRYRRRSRHHLAELDITAFMNLMVILVPFLLITAVFSRMTVLDLTLPQAAMQEQVPPKRELELEIIVRRDRLEVGDRNHGRIKLIGNRQGKHDLSALSQTLQRIKAQYPRKTKAMVLAERTTSYDALVQVMDTVRVMSVPQGDSVAYAELFPDIAIGDAPFMSRGGRAK